MKIQCHKAVIWRIDTAGSNFGVNTVCLSHLDSSPCFVGLPSKGWLHPRLVSTQWASFPVRVSRLTTSLASLSGSVVNGVSAPLSSPCCGRSDGILCSLSGLQRLLRSRQAAGPSSQDVGSRVRGLSLPFAACLGKGAQFSYLENKRYLPGKSTGLFLRQM